jgi:hypothetical protein
MNAPEPKSIHTWFNADVVDIRDYAVDIRISEFPADIPQQWLYYPSLQVNFTDHDEWAHGGFQWAGISEFRPTANKGVNWGGGSQWGGYGGIGITNTPFIWETQRWYRYRVCRVDDDSDGFHRWLFAILDYDSGCESLFGTVKTKSLCIRSAVVFTETGYGVKCDSPGIRIEWRNPCFRTPAGQYVPRELVATFNGTCPGTPTTNQELISDNPLHWYHQTNTARTTKDSGVLWRQP